MRRKYSLDTTDLRTANNEPGSYCIDFTLTFAFSKPQPDACRCLDQFHYRRVGACWRPSLAVVWRKDPGHYLTNSSRHTVASPSTSLTFTQFSEACFHLEMGKSAKFYKRSVSLYKPFSSIFLLPPVLHLPTLLTARQLISFTFRSSITVSSTMLTHGHHNSYLHLPSCPPLITTEKGRFFLSRWRLDQARRRRIREKAG